MSELTFPQKRDMSNKIHAVSVAMYDLLNLIEQQDSGMSSEFCARYPFDISFDELCSAVAHWQAEVQSKANFDGEEGYDASLEPELFWNGAWV